MSRVSGESESGSVQRSEVVESLPKNPQKSELNDKKHLPMALLSKHYRLGSYINVRGEEVKARWEYWKLSEETVAELFQMGIALDGKGMSLRVVMT